MARAMLSIEDDPEKRSVNIEAAFDHLVEGQPDPNSPAHQIMTYVIMNFEQIKSLVEAERRAGARLRPVPSEINKLFNSNQAEQAEGENHEPKTH